jgi:hypothetical protein
MKTRIIYTPDAGQFRNVWSYSNEYRPFHGDPEAARLKPNYDQLKKAFPDLPLEVAVVSVSNIIKNFYKGFREDCEQVEHPYIPIGVLDKALALKKKARNPSRAHSTSRTLDYLLGDSCFFGDPYFDNKRFHFVLLTALPHARVAIKGLDNVISLYKDKTAELGNDVISSFEECKKQMRETYGSFRLLRKAINDMEKRFLKNKVSDSFPLTYLPPTVFSIDISLVNTDESIEVPGFVGPIFDLLRAGCGVKTNEEVPDSIKEFMGQFNVSKFGSVKRFDGKIEDLVLPEPRTIITDLYIADHFPQLADQELEIHEFRLGN